MQDKCGDIRKFLPWKKQQHYQSVDPANKYWLCGTSSQWKWELQFDLS